jgi:hypothetical protein
MVRSKGVIDRFDQVIHEIEREYFENDPRMGYYSQDHSKEYQPHINLHTITMSIQSTHSDLIHDHQLIHP